MERINNLCSFLNASHSSYDAVAYIADVLEKNGYTALSETAQWDLVPGGKYYLIRSGTSVMAFRIPSEIPTGFMLSASHSDRPCFKVKENAELSGT